MRVAHGTYIGDGVNDRSIAVVFGGTPKLLNILSSGNARVTRLDVGGDLSFYSSSSAAGLVKSMSATGFVLGTDAKVNALGTTYYWWALVDTGAEDVVTGTYIGNGIDNRNITDAGLDGTPGFALILTTQALLPQFKIDGMGVNSNMWPSGGGQASNRIQAFVASGVEVGTEARVNGSGQTLYYCFALLVPGIFATSTYTGDGVAGRSLTGFGMTPTLFSTQNPPGRVCTKTPDVSGENTIDDLGLLATNRVTAFIADGVTLGSNSAANGSGTTYYALCLRDNLVLLTPTTASDTDTGAEAVVDVTLNVGGASPTTTSAEAVVGITIGLAGVSPTSTGASAALSLLSTTPSAALLEAMERGLHRWLHEVDLPDGTVLRSSSAGYSSLSRGHYAARVLGWGGWEVGISQDGVAAPQTTVDLADVDGALAALLAGEYEDEIEEGCESRIIVTAPGLDDWLIAFAGLATGEQSGPGEIRWTIRVDDLALQGVAPRGTWGVGAAWPLAEADARARIAPIVYGEHDGSSAGLGRGQVPTLVLDTVQDIRLVAAGAAVDIVRVWDDDGQVSGSNYTAATTARKGRSWTTITFSAAPTGTVTVDVQGIEDDGDGGGALLTNAAEQLAHLLSSFYFADAAGTAWQPTSARIDSASLAAIATWLDGRTYDGAVAYYQGEARSGYDVLREWQESLGVYAWWSGAGQITFGVRPLDGDPYETEHVLRWQSDDLDGRWAPRPERRDVTPGLSVRHQPSASGDYLASLEVRDPEATREGSASLDMPWSAAS